VPEDYSFVLETYQHFKAMLDEKDATIASLSSEVERLRAAEKKALAFLAAGLEA
jgi:hypothetical protein